MSETSRGLSGLIQRVIVEAKAKVAAYKALGSSTHASALVSNEEISTAKLPSFKKRTHNIAFSETLPPASTSRDPDCVPFWTSLTKDWSARLWSCIATGLHDSPLTYWNGSSKEKHAGSWFTVRAVAPSQTPKSSQKISSQSPPSLWRLITANEQQKEDAVAGKTQAAKKRKEERSLAKKEYRLPRARRLRIYPDKEQKNKLRYWFGVVRRAYNIAVAVHNGKDPVVAARLAKLKLENKKYSHAYAVKTLARLIEREGKEKWVLSVPQPLRDGGITDFTKALKSGSAKRAEQHVKGERTTTENFKFRSLRDATQSIVVDRRQLVEMKDDMAVKDDKGKDKIKKGAISDFLRSIKTKKEKWPDTVDAAVRVQMDRLGRVYLCFVREVEAVGENQTPRNDVMHHSTIALDPGVRTFQTLYDADGQAIEWGKGDMAVIFRLCRQADKIQGKINKKKNKKKGLRCAYLRIVARIKDKVKECHRKLALFIVQNYRVVLIPKFQVSRMIKCANRKISSKTVRQMCCWSHYAFRCALMKKAELYQWCKVVEVDEAYTSKTCEECGKLHQTLGSSKVFKCAGCGHLADRDIHAARNILLRYLTREGIKISV